MSSEMQKGICAVEQNPTDKDNTRTNQLSKPSRLKKKPDRFGDIVNDEADEEKEDSFEEMLGDDSSDEYIPDQKETNEEEDDESNGEETNGEEEKNVEEGRNRLKRRRIVHTIRPNLKKKKTDDYLQHNNVFWETNFDREFDELNAPKNSVATMENNEIGESQHNDDAGTIVDQRKSGEHMVGDRLDNGTSSKNVANDHGSVFGVTNKNTSTQDLIVVNNRILLEILARVRTMENALIKNGILNSAKNEVAKKNSFDEFHAFCKSNRLPLKNIEDMNTLEENLNDPEFEKVAIQILSKFPGMGSGFKGNQPKLLKKIMEFTVDRFFLAQFTYCGKLVKGHRKCSFKEKKNIVALLFAIACKIDKNYEEENFTFHLKDKILRYAGDVFRNKRPPNTGSSSSAESTVSASSIINASNTNGNSSESTVVNELSEIQISTQSNRFKEAQNTSSSTNAESVGSVSSNTELCSMNGNGSPESRPKSLLYNEYLAESDEVKIHSNPANSSKMNSVGFNYASRYPMNQPFGQPNIAGSSALNGQFVAAANYGSYDHLVHLNYPNQFYAPYFYKHNQSQPIEMSRAQRMVIAARNAPQNNI